MILLSARTGNATSSGRGIAEGHRDQTLVTAAWLGLQPGRWASNGAVSDGTLWCNFGNPGVEQTQDCFLPGDLRDSQLHLSSSATRTLEKEWRCQQGVPKSNRPGRGVLGEKPRHTACASLLAQLREGPQAAGHRERGSLWENCRPKRWLERGLDSPRDFKVRIKNMPGIYDRGPWRHWQTRVCQGRKISDTIHLPWSWATLCKGGQKEETLNFTETIPKNELILKTGSSK